MNRFLAAVRFLTVFPVPGRIRTTESDMGRSAPFFPLVGLLIGLGAGALDSIFSRIFPPLLASVIDVAALIAVSGGFHMDGLADTADGFFSSRPRERILEIMKDSHVGAMGVIAIVLLIALKAAALAAVPAGSRFSTLLLMPLAGRCALVIHVGMLDYARPEGGLGTVFARHRQKLDTQVAGLSLLAVGCIAAGFRGFCAALLSIGVAWLFSSWCRRKIGGFTGDTSGAVCELVELVPALAAAAF